MSNVAVSNRTTPSHIQTFLEKVAERLNILNYEIICNQEQTITDEGFGGDIYLPSIHNKDTNQTIHLAVKCALKDPEKRKEVNADSTFKNEVHFYSNIIPAFNQLQVERPIKEPFVEVPKFYYATLEKCKEALVMENLKIKGYGLWDKKKVLDDEHLRLIMKTYGKFHAMSLVLKTLKPNTYKQLVNEIVNVVGKSSTFKDLINSVNKDAFEALDPEEYPELVKKSEKYRKNAYEIFDKFLHKESKFSVMIQTDSWTNNCMFKYSEFGKLEDMKLIDFQIVSEASPVHDLSYFFYSSCSKEHFDKLDEYLKIYHDALSTTLRGFSCDPEQIFSFQQLRQEWAEHGTYGVLLSMMSIKIRLMENKDVQTIVNDERNENGDTTIMGSMLLAKVDKSAWKKRVTDIITHAYEINLL